MHIDVYGESESDTLGQKSGVNKFTTTPQKNAIESGRLAWFSVFRFCFS